MKPRPSALLFLASALAAIFARAQSDYLKARPDFQNQMYLAAPTNAPGTSLAQTKSVALVSGSIGDATSLTNAAPNDSQIFLTQSGIGQSFFAPNAPLSAPAILALPASTVAFAGNAAALSVIASGSEPVGYQWLRNGTAIFGATNATLVISNAQPANAGNYSVAVSNQFGAASQTTALTVETTAGVSCPQ